MPQRVNVQAGEAGDFDASRPVGSTRGDVCEIYSSPLLAVNPRGGFACPPQGTGANIGIIL